MEGIVYSTEQNQYAILEKPYGNSQERRCIDNKITGRNKCVGYCQYNEHPGFLTERHIKQHNCIGKGCHYFIAKPQKAKEKHGFEDQSNIILRYIKDNFLVPEGVCVVRIACLYHGHYVAHYVAITKDYDLTKCNRTIKGKFNVEISFENLNYNFETCVSLLMAN